MDKLTELELKRNSIVFELKGLRKEGAWPAHIREVKDKLRNVDAEISILKAGNKQVT